MFQALTITGQGGEEGINGAKNIDVIVKSRDDFLWIKHKL